MSIFDKWADSQPTWSQCIDCKWKIIGEFGCQAFPNKIPNEILLNNIKHDKPLEGQEKDFVYQKIEKPLV